MANENTLTIDPNYVMPIEEKLKVACETLDAYRDMLEITKAKADRYQAELLALKEGKPGYVLVPETLTAENGAKYALSGEFSQRLDLINAEGKQYSHPFTIDWTTIKDIYAAAIKHFVALAGES